MRYCMRSVCELLQKEGSGMSWLKSRVKQEQMRSPSLAATTRRSFLSLRMAEYSFQHDQDHSELPLHAHVVYQHHHFPLPSRLLTPCEA